MYCKMRVSKKWCETDSSEYLKTDKFHSLYGFQREILRCLEYTFVLLMF